MARIRLSKLSVLLLVTGLIAFVATFMLKSNPLEMNSARLASAPGALNFRPSAREPFHSTTNRETRKPTHAVLDLQTVDRAVLGAAETESDEELSIIIKDLSKAQVLEAIRYLQGPGKPGAPKDQMIASFVQAWAKLDPDAALEWAAQLPEWERDSMYQTVCISAAATDPLKAIEAAREIPDSARSAGMIENLADRWATVNLSEASRWARGLPKQGNRDQIISRIALVQSLSDPVAAANLILAEIPQNEAQDEAAMTVIHQWALKDPAAARVWVNAFPASSLRTRAMAELDGIESVRQNASTD